MARGSVNKVILIGNLGRDPEIRYTPTGLAIASLTMATSEVWKDKQSGENQERTEWHKIVLYQRLAEIAGEYLRKGSKIYLEGKLQTRKWQDKNTGQDRYTTEIVGESLQMLDAKQNSELSNNNSANPIEKSQPQSMESSAAALQHLDDDIPF